MDLLSLNDLSKQDILSLIDNAIALKKNPQQYADKLEYKTLAMIFQKTSTRTRVSFEAAMTQLGGHAMFLDWESTNLTLGKLQDEIKCMDRYVDVIMARVNKHSDLEAMAAVSKVPVINGLSDKAHPCQALGDLMTMKEKKGSFNITLAYIGDGNNVCNSLITGCKKVGIKIKAACPKGYEPLEKPDLITRTAEEAAKGADIIYTDTWVSMGQEKETEERLKVFKLYQVNKKLMNLSKNALFMHCLPAHRGLEVTDEVIDSKQSIVFDQAENRMHTEKAILLKLLGKI